MYTSLDVTGTGLAEGVGYELFHTSYATDVEALWQECCQKSVNGELVLTLM